MGPLLLEALVGILIVLLTFLAWQKYEDIRAAPPRTQPHPGVFQMYLDREADDSEIIVLEFQEGRDGRTRPLAEGVYETLDTSGQYVKRLEIRTDRLFPFLREEARYEMPVLLAKPAKPRRPKGPAAGSSRLG